MQVTKEESVRLKIGEIAKLCNISIYTLRHYDKIGLVKPRYIEPDSGYRYYSKEQLFELVGVKCLKHLGFSITEIKEYLQKCDRNEIHRTYIEKRQEIVDQIKELEKAKEQLDIRIDLYNDFFPEEEDVLKENQKIEIKYFDKRKIASARQKINFVIEERLVLANILQKLVYDNDIPVISPIVHVLQDNYKKLFDGNFDIELCHFVEPKFNKKYSFIREIPAGEFVTYNHFGGHISSFESFKKIEDWAKENKYKIIGPPILVYISTLIEVKFSDKIAFEIQLPVRKK